jgi:hypothetical protein
MAVCTVVSQENREIHPGVFESEGILDLEEHGCVGYVAKFDRLLDWAEVVWLAVRTDGSKSAHHYRFALEA